MIINPLDHSTVFADIFIPVFRKISEPDTVTHAEWGNPALSACFGKLRFEGSEPEAQKIIHHGADTALYQVPDLPFLDNKKITGVTVSVMFYDQVAATCVIVAT